MIIKLSVIPKTLKGEELEMSYPTVEQIKALPKTPEGQPDRSKLPKDSVRNILLDCLAYYEPDRNNRKEIFEIYSLASKIQEAGDELELDDVYRPLIVKVMENAVAETDKTNPAQGKGIYQHWCVAQVLIACGIQD